MNAENHRRSLRWNKIAAIFAAICMLTAGGRASALDDPGKPAGENLKIFDGKSKVIIVNGYSTSSHWPGITALWPKCRDV